ncbi:MAG TPA: hypothetical protein VMB79_03650, partial [Jatrophihabitans sp.]|nr:hypothetical protein [Jatrophihabitans sp.]
DWQGGYQLTGLPAVPLAVCFVPGWQAYQPQCYANAADAGTATPITPVAGQVSAGIDAVLAPGATSGTVTQNRASA